MPQATILTKSPPSIDFTSNPVKCGGWYGPTAGLHTIAIQTLNYWGRFIIEGTLAADPTDADWFPLSLNGKFFIDFPRHVDIPIYGPGYTGESVTLGFNIVVNCLYMRARIVRSHLIPPNAQESYISAYGSIDSVLLKW